MVTSILIFSFFYIKLDSEDTVESPSSEFEIYDNNGTVYYDQTGVTPSVGLHKLMIRAVNDTWQSIEAITEVRVVSYPPQ